jgi:hypothetical protein
MAEEMHRFRLVTSRAAVAKHQPKKYAAVAGAPQVVKFLEVYFEEKKQNLIQNYEFRIQKKPLGATRRLNQTLLSLDFRQFGGGCLAAAAFGAAALLGAELLANQVEQIAQRRHKDDSDDDVFRHVLKNAKDWLLVRIKWSVFSRQWSVKGVSGENWLKRLLTTGD